MSSEGCTQTSLTYIIFLFNIIIIIIFIFILFIFIQWIGGESFFFFH